MCVCLCLSLLSIKNIHCVSSFVAHNVIQYLEFIMIMNVLFLGQRPAKRVSHNGQGWGIGKGMVKPLFFTANIGKNTLFVGSKGGGEHIYIYNYIYIYITIGL